MHTHRRTRHGLALAGIGVLAATVVCWPTGPASAAPGTGSQTLSASVDEAGICNETAEPSDQVMSLTNGSASDSMDLGVTVSNPGNLSDVTTVSGHIATTSTATTTNGSVSSFRTSSTGQVTVSNPLGNASACHTHGFLSAVLDVQLPVATKGWLLVTRTQGANELTQATISAPDGTTPLESVLAGPAAHATDRVFLVPGTYQGSFGTQFIGGAFSVGKTASPMSATGRFVRAGAALAPATGTGTPYVVLPGATSCSRHTATLGWTTRAGLVTKASVLVNGAKVASVTGPKPGGSLVVSHLSAQQDVKLRAALTLANGTTRTVSRSYVPCSG